MEVGRVKNCSGEASVLAFRKDNGRAESGLFHRGNKDRLARQSIVVPSDKNFHLVFLVLNAFFQDLWLNITH